MLHPDSKRRISEIVKQANLLQKNGYLKTAKEIYTFTNILRGNKIPDDFLKKLELVFDIFHSEFEKKVPVGQNYRKEVFQEIADTTLEAIGRMGTGYPQALIGILPLFERLKKGQKITGEIAEEFERARAGKGIRDKNVIFHLYCYTYLIIVEGIYDELARILYFLTVASPSCVPSLQDLEMMTVKTIKRRIGTTPVFLRKWDDKNHIRNAIGHARADYDSTKDEVQFIDINMRDGTRWDSGIIPMKEFLRMALELEDSIQAFLYTFILLKIFDLIVSKNSFQ
jgi:hypothetical protein